MNWFLSRRAKLQRCDEFSYSAEELNQRLFDTVNESLPARRFMSKRKNVYNKTYVGIASSVSNANMRDVPVVFQSFVPQKGFGTLNATNIS